MEPIIEITIKGEVGAGKSTICECIKRALKVEGFHNWTSSGEEEESLVFEATYRDRIKALSHRNLEIRIKQMQASRSELKKLETAENSQ